MWSHFEPQRRCEMSKEKTPTGMSEEENGVKGHTYTLDYGGVTIDVRC